MGEHTLPPLPYNYDALEPYISEEIMRLHHDKHHKGYVEGLNKAEKKMQKARQTGDYSLIRHWEVEAAFNGAGHYLHTIFWDNMSPYGGGKPSGPLEKEIKHTFGSFEKFKEHFSKAAEKVQSVGWAMLVWSPRSWRTEILQAEQHQNLSQQDMIPLLVLDVWEHAYYLQYKNNRKDYIEAWWNVVNWDHVNRRYQEAKKIKWQPF
uniref:superoxide dismutase n=1 Tax=Halobacillus shinanisalinarum TaxID=2932258 RepID=UPI0037BFDB95